MKCLYINTKEPTISKALDLIKEVSKSDPNISKLRAFNPYYALTMYISYVGDDTIENFNEFLNKKVFIDEDHKKNFKKFFSTVYNKENTSFRNVVFDAVRKFGGNTEVKVDNIPVVHNAYMEAIRDRKTYIKRAFSISQRYYIIEYMKRRFLQLYQDKIDEYALNHNLDPSEVNTLVADINPYVIMDDIYNIMYNFNKDNNALRKHIEDNVYQQYGVTRSTLNTLSKTDQDMIKQIVDRYLGIQTVIYKNIVENYVNRAGEDTKGIFSELFKEVTPFIKKTLGISMSDRSIDEINKYEKSKLAKDIANEEDLRIRNQQFEDGLTESDIENENKESEGQNKDWSNFATKIVYSTLSKEIRKVLSTLVERDSNGSIILDDIGNVKYINVEDALGSLLNNMLNITDEKGFDRVLDLMSKMYYWVPQLIDAFKDKNNEGLKARFFSELHKTFTQYGTMTVQSLGAEEEEDSSDMSYNSLFILNGFSTSSLDQKWSSTIEAGIVLSGAANPIYRQNTGKVNKANVDLVRNYYKSKIYTRVSQMLKLGEYNKLTKFLHTSEFKHDMDKVLRNIGIEININHFVAVLDSYIKIISTGENINMLKTLDGVFTDILNILTMSDKGLKDNEHSVYMNNQSKYSSLSVSMGDIEYNSIQRTVYNNGKMYATFTNPSLNDRTFSLLKNMENKTQEEYEQSVYEFFEGSFMYDKNKNCLNSYINDLMHNKDLRTKHTRVVSFLKNKDTEFTKMESQQIKKAEIEAWANNRNDDYKTVLTDVGEVVTGYYSMHPFADSPVMTLVEMPIFRDITAVEDNKKVVIKHYQDIIAERLVNVIKQEHDRIVTVRDRKNMMDHNNKSYNPNILEIDNYDKNGDQFIFFPELNEKKYTVKGKKEKVDFFDYMNSFQNDESLIDAIIKELKVILNKRTMDYLDRCNSEQLFDINEKIDIDETTDFSKPNDKSLKYLSLKSLDDDGVVINTIDINAKPRLKQKIEKMFADNKISKEFRDAILKRIDYKISNDELEEELVKFKKTNPDFKFNGHAENIVPMSDLEKMLSIYAYNKIYAETMLMEVFSGDPAFQKDPNDHQKRNKGNHSGIQRIMETATFNYENVVYFADTIGPDVGSDLIQGVRSILSTHHFSNYDVDIAAYKIKNMVNTDGAALRPIEAYEKVFKAMGKQISDKRTLLAIQHIKNGTWNKSDVDALASQSKPLVQCWERLPSGREGENLLHQVQLKNSEFVMKNSYEDVLLFISQYEIAKQLKDENTVKEIDERNKLAGKSRLAIITKWMNDNHIDLLQFASGVKLGLTGVIDINNVETENLEKYLNDIIKIKKLVGYDQNEKPIYENTDEFNPQRVHKISVADMGEINSTTENWRDKRLGMGTQMGREMLNALQNADNNATYYIDIVQHGINVSKKDRSIGTFGPKDLISRYCSLIGYSVIDKYEELKRIFHSPEELSKRLIKLSQNGTRLDQDEYHALMAIIDPDDSSKVDFNIPLYDNCRTKETQPMLMSLINKTIVKRMFRGGTLYQGSEYVLEEHQKPRYVFNYDSKGNAVSIKYVECILPAYTREMFTECIDQKTGIIDPEKVADKIPEELLKAIGYRVPTEGKHSIMPLKIIGFMPSLNRNTIILPKGLTAITDSDFDIDETYVLIPEFKKNKNTGKYEKIIGDDAKPFDKWTQSERNNALIDIMYAIMTSDTGATQMLQTGGTVYADKAAATINILQHYNYKSLIDEFNTNFNSLFKDSSEEQKKEFRARIDELSKNENHDKLFEFLNLIPQNVIVSFNKKLREKIYFNDPDFVSYFHSKQSVGDDLISVSAIYRTNWSLISGLRQFGIIMSLGTSKGNKTTSAFKFNGHTIAHIGTSQYQFAENDSPLLSRLIAKNLGELIPVGTDAAKNPILDSIGIKRELLDMYPFMFMLGLSFNEVSVFMKQPIIERACVRYALNKRYNNDISSYISDELQKMIDNPEYRKDTKNSKDEVAEALDHIKINTDNSFLNEMYEALFTPEEQRGIAFLTTQAKIAKIFSHIYNLSKFYSGFVRNTQPDTTKHIGTDYADNESKYIALLYMIHKFNSEKSMIKFEQSKMGTDGKMHFVKVDDVDELLNITPNSPLGRLVDKNDIESNKQRDEILKSSPFAYLAPYFIYGRQAVKNMYKEHYLDASDAAEYILMDILGNYVSQNYDSLSKLTLEKLYTQLQTYLMTAIAYNNENGFVGVDRMKKEDGSLETIHERKLLIIKQYPKILLNMATVLTTYSNGFTNEEIMNTKLARKLFIAKPNRIFSVERLKLRSDETFTPENRQSYKNEWETLLNSKNPVSRDFAARLFEYNYIMYGNYSVNGSFSKIISTELENGINNYVPGLRALLKICNNIGQKLNTGDPALDVLEINTDVMKRFVHQFIENNLDVKELCPTLSLSRSNKQTNSELTFRREHLDKNGNMVLSTYNSVTFTKNTETTVTEKGEHIITTTWNATIDDDDKPTELISNDAIETIKTDDTKQDLFLNNSQEHNNFIGYFRVYTGADNSTYYRKESESQDGGKVTYVKIRPLGVKNTVFNYNYYGDVEPLDIRTDEENPDLTIVNGNDQINPIENVSKNTFDKSDEELVKYITDILSIPISTNDDIVSNISRIMGEYDYTSNQYRQIIHTIRDMKSSGKINGRIMSGIEKQKLDFFDIILTGYRAINSNKQTTNDIYRDNRLALFNHKNAFVIKLEDGTTKYYTLGNIKDALNQYVC